MSSLFICTLLKCQGLHIEAKNQGSLPSRLAQLTQWKTQETPQKKFGVVWGLLNSIVVSPQSLLSKDLSSRTGASWFDFGFSATLNPSFIKVFLRHRLSCNYLHMGRLLPCMITVFTQDQEDHEYSSLLCLVFLYNQLYLSCLISGMIHLRWNYAILL